MLSKSVKLYEGVHFYKEYEDHRNNLYFIAMDDDVDNWLEKHNIKYELDCEYFYINECGYIEIYFYNEEDREWFNLTWKDYHSVYDVYIPNTFVVTVTRYDKDYPTFNTGPRNNKEYFKTMIYMWLIENIGIEHFSWKVSLRGMEFGLLYYTKNDYNFMTSGIIVSFYDKDDATAFKMVWG